MLGSAVGDRLVAGERPALRHDPRLRRATRTRAVQHRGEAG
jgi:hypothetical protein